MRAIYNDNSILINLNELVAVRGEYLFKDDDVSMSENQIDYIAEKLRSTLTWDTLYHMVDSSILEFFDCHEHPEIWTDKHYGEIQPEPGREKELVEREKEEKQRKKNASEFEMVDLEGGAWTIQVPRRKDNDLTRNDSDSD
tara:strand:- start:7298 stop:7720 length:423 start_codon:yes stop_codon:yes gene_type:complete